MNARLDSTATFQIEAIAQPVLALHVAIFLPQQLLDDTVFRLVSFEGQESNSELFEYALELHANTVSNNTPSLNVDDLIGVPITVGIECPSEFTGEEMAQRFLSAVQAPTGSQATPAVGAELSFFNGIIASFAMAEQGVYRLTMKPALAMLKLSNAYQMHTQMSVSQAIANVLDAYNIAYSMQIVSNSSLANARVQDWLQAGETDYDFIQRLMGKAHLFYYFTHTANQHTVVFANYPSYPLIYPAAPSFRYCNSDLSELGADQYDVIAQYNYQRSLSSSSVNGIFTRQYATWEAQPLMTYFSQTAQESVSSADLPFYLFKSYQYGDTNDEVEDFTEATRAALEADACQFSGSSYCPHFRVGHQFHLSDLSSQASNPASPNYPEVVRPSFANTSFVLTQIKHQANADGVYKNEFQATKASGLISKFSIQETQQGSLYAVVVGYNGDTEPSDWTHFLPANFDPEQTTFVDNNASGAQYQAIGVYVNFCTDAPGQAPTFVKLGSSMQSVPEVGALVVVSRAQDESELPEVQNVIATDGNKCIMPTGWDANTHVGNNYSTSYGDANNVSFGQYSQANLPNAVGIVLNRYGTSLFRDCSYAQGASYSFSVAESVAASFSTNDTELWGPYGGAADIASASESSGSTYSRQYASVSSSFSNIGTSYSNATLGKSESHSFTTGTTYSNSTQNGDITNISSVNADTTNTSTIVGDTHDTHTQTGDTFATSTNNGNTTSTSMVSGVSTNTSLNAMTVNTNLVGLSVSTSATVFSNSNSMVSVTNNNSVTGAAVNLSFTGATMDTSMVGMSNSTSMRGLVTDTSMTGLVTSTSLTGLSTSTNLTGISSNTALTGVSSSTSLTGVSDQTAITGSSTSVSIEGVSNSMAIRGESTNMTIAGSSSNISISGDTTNIDIYGAAQRATIGPEAVNMELSGVCMQIISAIKLFM